MNIRLLRSVLCMCMSLSFSGAAISQTVLNANGIDPTYELINSVLAPGYDVVETPDCVHPEVKHIDQVYDSTLEKYVFRFILHKHPDNDRCKTFDRQRTEIKSYDKSPDNLKATLDEKIVYKWRFKVSSDFQASSKFTHLHQIKGVGGPHDAMPLITLNARKSSPDKLELRYAEELNQITLDEIPLADFRGEWIEAEEIILFQEANSASYAIKLVRMSDTSVLFDYSSTTLKMWKTDADFLRPKWGIYRSLLDSNSLKDEDVLFSDFSVEELNTASVTEIQKNGYLITPNPVGSFIQLSSVALAQFNRLEVFDMNGGLILSEALNKDRIRINHLSKGLFIIRLSNLDFGEIYEQRMIKE